MELTLRNYQEYLKRFYSDANDETLFMKLIEEVGELATALNKKHKIKDGEFSKQNLGEEIIDVIYFACAIAVTNNIDLETALLAKDKEGSARYKRNTCLEEYLKLKK